MLSAHGPQSLGAPFVLQTYTAVYYVLADLLMLSLYFHYKFKKRPSLCEYGVPSGRACRGQRESRQPGRKWVSHCPVINSAQGLICRSEPQLATMEAGG